MWKAKKAMSWDYIVGIILVTLALLVLVFIIFGAGDKMKALVERIVELF